MKIDWPIWAIRVGLAAAIIAILAAASGCLATLDGLAQDSTRFWQSVDDQITSKP
jgi:hypothetical protein